MYYKDLFGLTLLLYSILMQTQNIPSLRLALFTLVLPLFILCQRPPPIHKIPLRYTQNYVYYGTLNFGSQGQRIEVQIDTGSSTMAVFCDICKDKCILDQQFKTSQSKTFKNITCGAAKVLEQSLKITAQSVQNCLEDCFYSSDSTQCTDDISYGAGALGSYLDYDLVLDFIGVGDPSAKALSTFGCIYDEKNFQEGIWGVSFKPENQFLDVIVDSETANGLTSRKLFTICTNGIDSVMNIGGIDSTYHIGQGVDVRVDSKMPSWWKLHQQDIGTFSIENTVIRNTDVSFGRKGIILDSGTDIIMLPEAVVVALISKVDELCHRYNTLCARKGSYEVFDATYEFTKAETFFRFIPPLKVELGGKILETPLSNYFWKISQGAWALGIARAQKYGFQMSILGSIWMNNFDVVFNREQAKVTIFDISRCSPPPARFLQTNDQNQTDPDAYELPRIHGSVNTYQRLSNLKIKHQRSMNRMQEGN